MLKWNESESILNLQNSICLELLENKLEFLAVHELQLVLTIVKSDVVDLCALKFRNWAS